MITSNIFKSSYNDSDLVGINPDSFCQQRLRETSLQPKQAQSPSDLKPPTLNSSFLVNQQPLTDPQRQSQSQKESLISKMQFERLSQTNQNDEAQLSIKHLYKNHSKKLSFFRYTPKLSIRMMAQQRFVRRFMQNLFQRTSLHQEKLFPQKSLIAEDYLTQVDNTNLLTEDAKFIIDSQSLFVYVWNILMLATISIFFVWIPVKIAFSITDYRALETVAIIQHGFDICLSLNKTYISQASVIFNRSLILQNYLKTTLLPDLLHFLFLILVVSVDFSYPYSIVLQVVYFYFSFQKFRMILNALVEDIYISDDTQNTMRIVSTLLGIMEIAHIMACFWYIIGAQGDETSWISQLMMEQKAKPSQYLQSLFWSVSILATMGWSHFESYNDQETLFTTFGMIFAHLVQAKLFYSVYQYLKRVDEIQAKQNKALANVNQFLSKNNIPLQLRSRIRSYLSYYSQQDTKTNLEESSKFIHNLPEALKQELLLQMRGQAIRKCKILQKFSSKSLNQVVQHIHSVRYNPDEQIQGKSLCDDFSLYIIQNGQVEIYDRSPNDKKVTSLQTLGEGQVFGEWGFFTNQPHIAFVRAIGFVRAIKIPQNVFLQIVRQVQQDKENYFVIQYELLFYGNVSWANLRCYNCTSTQHILHNCPQLKYRPDIERVVRQLDFHEQGRMDHIRAYDKSKRKLANRSFSNFQLCREHMKVFREHYNYDMIDLEPEDYYSQEEPSESSDAISSMGYSNNLIETQNEKGEIQSDSVIRNDRHRDQSRVLQDMELDETDMIVIRPNGSKSTVNTAQFQFQLEQANASPRKIILIQQDQQSLQNLKPPPYQMDKMKRTNSSLQLSEQVSQPVSSQMIANEGHVPSVKKIKNQAHFGFKSEYESSSSGQKKTIKTISSKPVSIANPSEKKKNLSKIREEDSDTLNLSCRKSYDDFQSLNSPHRRNGSQQTKPNNNNNNARQSMKRFSSKLSSIPIKSGTITQQRSNLVATINRQTMNAMTNPLVDLSIYRREDEQCVDDKMCEFEIFFPQNNASCVVARYNRFLMCDHPLPSYSRYTFKNRVKKMIYNLNVKTYFTQLGFKD